MSPTKPPDDSDDRMHAVSPRGVDPTRMLRDVLNGMNDMAREIGTLASKVDAFDTRLSDHRDVRDDVEARLRDVETKLTVERTRSGIIFAMLGAVGATSVAALIAALVKIALHA